MRCLAVVFCLLGCNVEGGGEPPGPAPLGGPDGDSFARSGVRIRARVLKTSGGAEAFVGHYDAQREENCRFQKAADGTYRCLPTDGLGAAHYFADPDCTIRAVTYPGCDADHLRYGMVYDLCNGGADVIEVHELGEVVDGQIYFQHATGCLPSSPGKFRPSVREIPLDEFATGDVEFR